MDFDVRLLLRACWCLIIYSVSDFDKGKFYFFKKYFTDILKRRNFIDSFMINYGIWKYEKGI